MDYKKIIEKLSEPQCESILETTHYWMWDERLGKKPLFYDRLANYEKVNWFRMRCQYLFLAFYPFTKAHYLEKAREEIFKKYPQLRFRTIKTLKF